MAVLNVTSISGVLFSILGMIYLLNWSLGVTESIGIDMFIGFSVDYIVHVGHCYVDNI